MWTRRKPVTGAVRAWSWTVLVATCVLLDWLFRIETGQDHTSTTVLFGRVIVGCAFIAIWERLFPLGRGTWAKLKKTTVLDGHYASGDHECFVFDRHRGPEEHNALYREWLRTMRDPTDDPPDHVLDESCRVYPGALIPEGADGQLGRWKITVEFEPIEPKRSAADSRRERKVG